MTQHGDACHPELTCRARLVDVAIACEIRSRTAQGCVMPTRPLHWELQERCNGIRDACHTILTQLKQMASEMHDCFSKLN
jgi:hypothetical protein